MIAPINFLPAIDHGGRITPLDEGWLVDAVQRAASQAGYSIWWGKQVAGALLLFLREEEHPPVLTVEAISRIVKKVATQLGAPGLAAFFSPLPPRALISLASLAHESGMELVFFQRLREAIHRELIPTVGFIHLYGLRPCIKHLCGSATWGKRCVQMQHELIDHIDSQIAKTSLPDPIEILVT